MLITLLTEIEYQYREPKTKIEIMTMKRQNKLGSYLTLTVGVGCAASVAEGAIQVVDLSEVATTSLIFFPSATGDSVADMVLYTGLRAGALYSQTYSNFYGGQFGDFSENSSYAPGYTAGPANFPDDVDFSAVWYNNGSTDFGFQVGLNYVAFRDTANNVGWVSFTLDSLTSNGTRPISSFGHFVYDDTSTSPANAIPLETAIAAVPEPSSLALLALGSVGLAARRQRKKAA